MYWVCLTPLAPSQRHTNPPIQSLTYPTCPIINHSYPPNDSLTHPIYRSNPYPTIYPSMPLIQSPIHSPNSSIHQFHHPFIHLLYPSTPLLLDSLISPPTQPSIHFIPPPIYSPTHLSTCLIHLLTNVHPDSTFHLPTHPIHLPTYPIHLSIHPIHLSTYPISLSTHPIQPWHSTTHLFTRLGLFPLGHHPSIHQVDRLGRCIYPPAPSIYPPIYSQIHPFINSRTQSIHPLNLSIHPSPHWSQTLISEISLSYTGFPGEKKWTLAKSKNKLYSTPVS